MADENANFLQILERILKTSVLFQMIFDRSHKIDLPGWYIAGGSITQTVWNSKLNLSPLHGLKDIDLVYFNSNETEFQERAQKQKIRAIYSDLPIPIDVVNEARVHQWYTEKFGYSIPAYKSSEDAIQTFLPAFSVGVKIENKELKIFAPFGLADTFNMIVRPNERQINEDIYMKMVERLKADWPQIKVISYGQ
jgi:uncharacterized protein